MPHRHPACQSYFEAKVNGTKQLVEVAFQSAYPHSPFHRPFRICVRHARSAKPATRRPSLSAKSCWSSRALPTTSKNTETQTVVVLHLGGHDSLSHLTGIHGVHLGHIEYIATDPTRTTIPWVQRRNADGSETAFGSSTLKGAVPQGERRVMDCIDCHNRASHTFATAEDALNRAMADGAVSPSLPWVHKEGLALLKADYASQDEARAEDSRAAHAVLSQRAIRMCWRRRPTRQSSGRGIGQRLHQNVFPEMKVTWGTHPNHIGHMNYPGCFRCHDGDHMSKDGTVNHAGLRGLPQPAGGRRSQAQGTVGSGHSIRLCRGRWSTGAARSVRRPFAAPLAAIASFDRRVVGWLFACRSPFHDVQSAITLHFNLVAAAHAVMIERGFQPDFPAGTDAATGRDRGASRSCRLRPERRTCATCSGLRSTTTPPKISIRSSGPSSCPTAASACWWAWPMWTRACREGTR